jgi:hypothetical protein
VGKRWLDCVFDFDQIGFDHTRQIGTLQGAPSRRMDIQMSNLDDDLKVMIRRNKLLGMWAADKLGLVGESAEAYSNDLAVGTLDPERNDVLSKVRKDFDVAGVAQSDEVILRVMNKFWLQALRQGQSTPREAVDAAAVQIARNLSSR